MVAVKALSAFREFGTLATLQLQKASPYFQQAITIAVTVDEIRP